MKTCTKCKEIKPTNEFHKNPQTKDGLKHNCKVCVAAYVKENKALINQSKTKWRVLNRGLDRHSKRMSELKKLNKVAPNLTEKDIEKILAFYIEAAELTQLTGVLHCVDHIDALCNTGLHHPDNLQVITQAENVQKYFQEDRIIKEKNAAKKRANRMFRTLH